MPLLAHSARPDRGIGPQYYETHTSAVCCRAAQYIEGALAYREGPDPALSTNLAWAALYHDLGKLDPDNQEVLAADSVKSLPYNHVDAGVAHLRSNNLPEAAILVYSHHRGLCSLPYELGKEQKSHEDRSSAALRAYAVKDRTDEQLLRPERKR